MKPLKSFFKHYKQQCSDINFQEDGHQYYVQGIEVTSVTKIMESLKLQDYSFVDPIYLRIGTEVHMLAARHLDPSAPLKDEFMPEAMDRFTVFTRLWKESGFRRIMVERPLHFSDATGPVYCGTPDQWLYHPDEPDTLILGEIKTGTPKRVVRLQTAAYLAAAMPCMVKADISRFRRVVWDLKTGKMNELPDFEVDFAAWTSCLTLYRWLQSQGTYGEKYSRANNIARVDLFEDESENQVDEAFERC